MKAAEYLLKPALVLCIVAQMFLIQRIERQRDSAIKLSEETLKTCKQLENQATQAIATATRVIALYERTH